MPLSLYESLHEEVNVEVIILANQRLSDLVESRERACQFRVAANPNTVSIDDNGEADML